MYSIKTYFFSLLPICLLIRNSSSSYATHSRDAFSPSSVINTELFFFLVLGPMTSQEITGWIWFCNLVFTDNVSPYHILLQTQSVPIYNKPASRDRQMNGAYRLGKNLILHSAVQQVNHYVNDIFENMLSRFFKFSFISSFLYPSATHLMISFKHTIEIRYTTPLLVSIYLQTLFCTRSCKALPTSVDVIGRSFLCYRSINEAVSCIWAALFWEDPLVCLFDMNDRLFIKQHIFNGYVPKTPEHLCKIIQQVELHCLYSKCA